ncbi:MAG: NapC/NirT family cytochrome c [Alphaproteobacteria bacterium]
MRLLRRWLFLLLAGAPVAGAAVFGMGVAVTDYLEQDNVFCISCHVSNAKRLHQDKFDTFFPIDGQITTLAAAHHGAGNEPFKCVNCHNGATLTDKLLIKTQAARDTVAYLLGDFEEPELMRFSLGNRLCLKCHSSAGKNPEKETAFHNAGYHTNLPFICYACHTVHPQAKRETRFLKRDIVQPLCDECHAQL